MNKWSKLYSIIYVFICFNLVPLIGQAKLKINNEQQESVYLAHVKFTCIAGLNQGKTKWLITDTNGYVVNPFWDTTNFEVSHVGYEIYNSTLLPSENKVIELKSSMFDLNEMVVTAQFVPVEVQKSIYHVKVINSEKITQKAATNLRDVLHHELNFRTNNGHANETAINLSGLSGNHVKFMIDGVPVEGRIDGNIDLSQINLTDVKKIEIIEGPTSVTYGSNALGGTINIITNKNQQKRFKLSVNTYYESVGQYNINGHLGYKFNKQLIKINGGRNFFNGFNNNATGRFKDWKPREQYFGSFIYSRRLKHLKLSLISNGFNELMTSRGKPIAPYELTAFDTYYTSQRWTNKLLIKGRITSNNNLDITLSQSYYSRNRNIYFKDLVTLEEFPSSDMNGQDTTIYNNYLFRGVYGYNNTNSAFNFLVGTEFKNDFIRAERVSNNVQNIADYSLFGNISYRPHKLIKIQPAIRYAYNTKYNAPLIPSINLLLNPSSRTQIRASYAKGFRTPSLKELYLEFHFNSTINLWGNDNLMAENSDHINVSLDYHKSIGNHKLSFTPKGFYSKINNLINLVKVSPVDWRYMNLNHVTTKGFSFDLKYEFKHFNLFYSINYYGNKHAQFKQDESEYDFQFTTENRTSITYIYLPIDLTFNVHYKYTGKINSFYIDENTLIQKSSIGDYHTLDATINKYFYNKKVLLNIGVKNIFNTKDVPLVGDVSGVSSSNNATSLSVLWGRTYFLSLNYNL